MKNFLLLAAMAATVGVASAQTDITPKNYHFNTAETLPISQASYGAANPDAGFWKANNLESEFNEGLLVIGGNGFTAGNKGIADKINNIVKLVDLGGTVGKVFCYADYGSNANEGLKAITGFDYGIEELDAGHPWFHFNFYLDPKSTPTRSEGIMHVKVTYNVYSPEFTRANGVTKMYAATDQNGVRPIQADANTNTPLDLQKCWAEDPMTEEMAYDPTAWIEYEWDIDCPDADTEGEVTYAPMRLKTEYSGSWSPVGVCIFIKDITITHLPDVAECRQGAGERTYNLVKYEMGAPGSTAVKNVAVADEALTVSVNGAAVTLSENAQIYTIAGVKVAEAAACQSVELANGFYVAVAGQKAVKFAVK